MLANCGTILAEDMSTETAAGKWSLVVGHADFVLLANMISNNKHK